MCTHGTQQSFIVLLPHREKYDQLSPTPAVSPFPHTSMFHSLALPVQLPLKFQQPRNTAAVRVEWEEGRKGGRAKGSTSLAALASVRPCPGNFKLHPSKIVTVILWHKWSKEKHFRRSLPRRYWKAETRLLSRRLLASEKLTKNPRRSNISTQIAPGMIESETPYSVL